MSLWFWFLSWLISTFIAVILLARTEWIVAMLKFPEDPPSSGMEPWQLLRVGLVVLGAFTVIEALPAIGSAIYTMTFNSDTSRVRSPDLGRILSPALKFILGCIVTGRSERFAHSVFPASQPAP